MREDTYFERIMTFLFLVTSLPRLKIAFSYELDINFHVLASQLLHHVMHLGRHQQSIVTSSQSYQHNANRGSEACSRCVRIVFLLSYMGSLCHVRNKIICIVMAKCLCAHSSGLLVSISLVASQLGKWIPKWPSSHRERVDSSPLRAIQFSL